MITTYEEEVQLRILTGREVGKLLERMGGNKLALVSVTNLICNVLSSAVATSFTRDGKLAYNFIVEPGRNESEVAERIKQFAPDVIALMYGGEMPVEELKTSMKNLLKQLASKKVKGKIIFHVRAYLAGGVTHSIEDSEVKRHLEENESYVYTADLDNGIMILNKLSFANGSIELIPLLHSSLSFEHTVLLNKSLAGRTLKFEK